MRKQYSFLNKNGLKADGLNLDSTRLKSTSPFQLSQSHMDISTILKALLKNIIVSQKSTDLINALLMAWKPYLKQVAEDTPLNQICDLISIHIVTHLKKSDPQLSDLIWLNSLSVLEEQIGLYKKYRTEVNLKAEIVPPVHLDDFNDFESEDVGVQWSANTDKINENIIARLRQSGKLHPAVGKSQYTEQAHLRQVFEVLLTSLDKSNTLFKNRALQIVVREVAVCQVMAPFLNKISHPDVINPFILEKASRRLIVKNTVNNFLKTLDSQYLVFPPVFLISQYAPANFTIAERSKYVDLVIKYTKRATSIIDLATVRHEVLRELKKRTEELDGDTETSWDETDGIKRYVRGMRVLLRRLERRIVGLTTDPKLPPHKLFKSHIDPHSHPRSPRLTLAKLLQEFYKSHEVGQMDRGLFYFMDFLEGRGDFKRALAMLRFCGAAEKYRGLVGRVTTGVMEEAKGYEPLDHEVISGDSHVRFRKEIQKLITTFMTPEIEEVFSKDLMDSFRRYASATAAFHPDDYACAMRAQDTLVLELQHLFVIFEHHDAFFKWTGWVCKSRTLQTESANVRIGVVGFYEGSALISCLEDELVEGCMRMTGQQRGPRRRKDDEETSDFGIITLDDGVVLEVAAVPAVEEEEEEHVPGELLHHTSKLYQVQLSLERTMQQVDSLKLLQWKLFTTDVEQDPLSAMQKHVLEQAREQLSQEIADLGKQKARLESQEEREAFMPGQCFVSVQEVQPDPDLVARGVRVVTYFLVKIEQKHPDVIWTVKRRYSDFEALHKKLRDKFPVDDFDFPGKSTILWSRLRNEIKSMRTTGLEKYLQRLVDNRDISKSEHVRNFLASTFKPQKRDRLFNFEFDQDANHGLKMVESKLAETLSKLGVKKNLEPGKMLSFLDTRRKSHSDDDLGNYLQYSDEGESVASDDEFCSEEGGLDFENSMFVTSGPLLQAFTKLVLGVFEFTETNGWLRQNAAVILLEQIAGKGMESGLFSFTEENIMKTLKKYRDLLVRSDIFKAQVTVTNSTALRVDIKTKIQSAYACMFSQALGIDTSTRNTIEILEMFQNETINKHFLFTQLDSLVELLKSAI